MNESLWGNIPKPGNLNTPNAVLTEQGKFLESATEGALVGIAVKKATTSGFTIDFFIHAERLNNYRYHLFKVTHDVELYPLRIFREENGARNILECQNEAEFKRALADILSSSSTGKIIEALLAQVRDDGEEEIPF